MRPYGRIFSFCQQKLVGLKAFDDGDPSEFIRFDAILDAAKLVVKLLAPRTWLAVTKGVRFASLRIVDT